MFRPRESLELNFLEVSCAPMSKIGCRTCVSNESVESMSIAEQFMFLDMDSGYHDGKIISFSNGVAQINLLESFTQL